MGRRSRQSPFEDMVEVASLLPWWVCLVCAVAGYFMLHHLATMDIVKPSDMAGFGKYGQKQMIKAIASFGQYIVAIIFIFGALTSALNQRKRGKIFNKQTSINSIRQLSWRDFEQLISEAYRKQGYQVMETEDGPDGGIDLILRKNGKKILVQCKHWKKQKVGVKEVRELNGIVAAKGAYSGILVTSGAFTTEALNFAEESPIELIDGEKLTKLIPQIESSVDVESSHNLVPSCPKCGNSMVKKIAKQGFNAGNEFWGCPTYPKCKGTRNIIN